MAASQKRLQTIIARAAVRNSDPTSRRKVGFQEERYTVVMVRDAGALLNSLNLDTEEAVEPARILNRSWLNEIQRRAAELDSGVVTAVPWAEVDAKLQAVLTRGRQTLAFHPETGA